MAECNEGSFRPKPVHGWEMCWPFVCAALSTPQLQDVFRFALAAVGDAVLSLVQLPTEIGDTVQQSFEAVVSILTHSTPAAVFMLKRSAVLSAVQHIQYLYVDNLSLFVLLLFR